MCLGGAVDDACGSGDYGCVPRTSLKRQELDGCNNVPFLSPANDSRVNLLLLLADRGLVGYSGSRTTSFQDDYGPVPFATRDLHVFDAKAPPSQAGAARAADDSYARGEGSRCRSNTEEAAKAFVAQVTASADVPEAEQKELERSRRALLGACSWNDAQVQQMTPVHVESPLGREFAAYVGGVRAFYAGAWDEARGAFESLRGSHQPWLAETAQYMVGRSELNRAQQTAFDEWGFPLSDRVDRAALEAAEAAFRRYLEEHPSGSYAASAKGLLRRTYWLLHDRGRLGQEYAWLLANPDSPLRNVGWPDLAIEIDTKLLGYDPENVNDPTFVAVMDLMAMRGRDRTLRARLDAQRPIFASSPGLYAYLASALSYYVDRDPARTLKGLPTTVPDGALDAVAFSEQTLRGFALEGKGDWAAARTLWRTLLPRATGPLQREQVEVALAMNCERSGRLADVFARDSPITQLQIRRRLLKQVAGPALLRRQSKDSTVSGERDVALFTLLYKELAAGRYGDFLADFSLLPANVVPPEPDSFALFRGFSPAVFAWPGGTMESGYTCPPLRSVVRTLAKHPTDAAALNCRAEFVLRNYLEGAVLGLPQIPDDLGGTPSQFPSKAYARLDDYLRVMGDAKAGSEDRAYALYRALKCFASSGFNHCGDRAIPVAQRRQWFRTLKTRYASTRWAKDLEVFW